MRLPAIAVLAGLFAASEASGEPPIVIVAPRPAATVPSPLSSPTMQTNQALLSQIAGTLSQQRFAHQILTTQAAIRARDIERAAERTGR